MNDEPMLTVSSSSGRKVTDGDFGSFDKNYHISMRLPMVKLDDDVLAQVDRILESIDDKLEERIASRMALWMESDTFVSQAKERTKTPETQPGAPQEGTVTFPDQSDGNKVRMTVTAMRVKNHPDKDMKIVFALGDAPDHTAYKGNWKKFGVPAYPETYTSFFDPEQYGLGDHQPGARLFADVYLKDDGKTPEKVARFFNHHGVAYKVMEEYRD